MPLEETSRPRGAPTTEDQPGERFFPATRPGDTPRREMKSAVAIARTTERYRDHETIHALVKAAVDLLGGIEGFVQRGQRVLIKPNQTGAFLSDEGMTTDPRVVAALVRLCYEAGAADVVVGEASGMGRTHEIMQATADVKAAGSRVIRRASK